MSDETERLRELDAVRDEVADAFQGLSMPQAGLRTGPGWAPLDDLRHLTLSVFATTRGFQLAGAELDRRFGAAEGPGRGRAELGRVAMAGLEAGGAASEAITPPPLSPEEATDATRDRCISEWRDACDRFRGAVSAWSDAALDRHRFPHPFLGLFTLREWVDFHVLHASHHLRGSARRGKRPGG